MHDQRGIAEVQPFQASAVPLCREPGISNAHPVNDEEFLRHFEDRTLTHAQWNHRAHLKVAYLYLLRFPFDDAFRRIRENIRALNAAHGVTDSPTRGYHDTITRAWLQLVHTTLAQFGPAETADAFLDAQSQLGNKRTLLLFYSRDLLMSAEAKASIVAPDLTPLPWPPHRKQQDA